MAQDDNYKLIIIKRNGTIFLLRHIAEEGARNSDHHPQNAIVQTELQINLTMKIEIPLWNLSDNNFNPAVQRLMNTIRR